MKQKLCLITLRWSVRLADALWLFVAPLLRLRGHFLYTLLHMNNKTTQKAGAIILSGTNKKEIALLYRFKQKDWSFPKGHVEPGENAVQTMVREIKEETGLNVRILRELPDLDYIHTGGSVISTKMFLVQSEDNSLLRLEHEGDDIKWIPTDKVTTVLSYDNLKEYFNKVSPLIK